MPKKSTLTGYFKDLAKLPKYNSEQELSSAIKLKDLYNVYSDAVGESCKDFKDLEKVFHKTKSKQPRLLASRVAYIKAKNSFATANLGLVLKAVRCFNYRNLSTEDLIQEGNVGLLHAIDKFDPTLGYRFSTYAVFAIKQYIIQAINKRESEVKIPVEELRTMRLLKKEKRLFLTIHGREPTDEELAFKLNLKVEDILLRSSDTTKPSDLLVDQLVGNAPTVVAMLEKKQLYNQVQKVMDSLSPKERAAVEDGVIKAATREKLRKLLTNY